MEQTKKYQTEEDRMDGLSCQAAVESIGNRYDLILVGARRARELSRGDAARVTSRRGPVVTAMKEIEAGKVTRNYLFKEQDIDPPRRRRT